MSPEGVAVVADVLGEHARREHFGTSVSKTGIRKPNPQPSWTGFDIPAVLFFAAAPGDSFTATVDAAAKAKRIVGVSRALLGGAATSAARCSSAPDRPGRPDVGGTDGVASVSVVETAKGPGPARAAPRW